MLEQTYEKLWEFVTYRIPEAKDIDSIGRNWLLGEVGTYIRNYIALSQIPICTPGYPDTPGSLFYVWAGMAVDVLRYWLAQMEDDDGDPISGIDLGDVSEIKLGDTTVRRGGQLDSTLTSQINQQHLPNLDSLVYNYQHTLDQFRKMRW